MRPFCELMAGLPSTVPEAPSGHADVLPAQHKRQPEAFLRSLDAHKCDYLFVD